MPSLHDKYQKIEILTRKNHTHDLWTIRARPQQKLSFKPGQYATLAVERNGRMIQRAYSIVSSPLEDELEFFIELVPHGELTPLLFEAEVGDFLWMRRQARGLFTLDASMGRRNSLLMCTVTGVAPYVSMVRTLERLEEKTPNSVNQQLVVIQAASRSWELAYCDELEAAEKRRRWLRYIPSVSRPWEDLGWTGEVGRVEDIARKYIDSLCLDCASTTGYLCGHPQMIQNCKGILNRRGFPKEFVREEIYWIPAKPAREGTVPATVGNRE